jgi:hypothetical protein
MLYCSLYVVSGLAAWAHLKALSFHTFLLTPGSGSHICNLIICHKILVKLCIDLLVNLNFNRGLENDCMFIGRRFRQRLHIWTL